MEERESEYTRPFFGHGENEEKKRKDPPLSFSLVAKCHIFVRTVSCESRFFFTHDSRRTVYGVASLGGFLLSAATWEIRPPSMVVAWKAHDQ